MIIINSLSFSRIHYESTIFCDFIILSTIFLRFHYKSIIFFVNSLWIHYRFGDFTMDSQSLLRFRHDFLSRYNFLSFFSRCYQVSYCLFCDSAINSLHLPRIHFDVTLMIANKLWLYYDYDQFILNSLSFSGTLYLIHYSDFCEFTSISHWLTRIYSEFTMNLRYFREYTMNPLSLLRIHYQSMIFTRF